MESVKALIEKQKPRKVSEYISLYKKVIANIDNSQLESPIRKLKIAFLPSFTSQGIKETLFIKCCELGIIPEIYVCDYNLYQQDILDENSDLYTFNPDLLFLFIDLRSIAKDLHLLPYQHSDDDRKSWTEENLNNIELLANTIKSKLKTKVVIHNLAVPTFSPLGILESKQNNGFIESIQDLNYKLRQSFKEDNNIFVFDYDAFCSNIGKKNILDSKMYYLADMVVNMNYIPHLCEQYLAYIKPMASINKKCLVLDLDNTLWGGIIGENGLGGIKLGPTPEGRPFYDFQKYILSLLNRGIILAINSNNNYEDALQAINNHPYMILKEEHFAAMQINWKDKIVKMEALAEDINIGLDSIVFIDDDKANCEMVKNALPEVTVVDLPEDPSLYLETISGLSDFNSFQLTAEDKQKGKIYAQQRKRNESKMSSLSLEEHLNNLNMTMTIEQVNELNKPRIAQLTQKTNQFNMTTKRYLEEDIESLSKDEQNIVLSVKVEDKFGDNGIVGTAIVKKLNRTWIIDSFLLSCRVIGRRIEDALLAYLVEIASTEGVHYLQGQLTYTDRNKPAQDFYKRSGFKLIQKTDAFEVWKYKLHKSYPYPEFINIVKG